MYLPMVSCIMPTCNRQEFIPFATKYFLEQDYVNIELIIEDDSDESIIDLIPKSKKIKYHYCKNKQSVGLKRNSACKNAIGEIIIHWDDDDWYATNWVSRQVNELITSGADVCGISNLNFYILNLNKSWIYTDNDSLTPWVYGGTLVYWKSFWEKHPFKNMQAGEDNDFIWNNPTKVHAHKYTEGYLGIIHNDNIGIVPFENLREKIQVMKWMRTINNPELPDKTASLISNSTSLPLVTCIMPTANRQKFIPTAIKYFLEQDYANKELVIIDDGEFSARDLIPELTNIKYHYSKSGINSIGTKRNEACEKALGSVIVHLDDDDWYATDWITQQVTILLSHNVDICGLNQIQFYSVTDNKYWMTKNMNSKKLWLSGATLAYYKSFWEKHPFKNLQIGEDDDFVRNNGAKLFAHDYYQGFIAIIHKQNTSIKVFQ